VARLYTDAGFLNKLQAQFEGDYELRFNLAPPMFSKRDPNTGHLLKREFGPWMMKAFAVLARFRFLRGTALDIFAYSAERKRELADIAEYQVLLDSIVAGLAKDNYEVAVELASLPGKLRGFGHVKDRNREKLVLKKNELLKKFQGKDDTSTIRIFNAA